jgi:hypothetical protein
MLSNTSLFPQVVNKPENLSIDTNAVFGHQYADVAYILREKISICNIDVKRKILPIYETIQDKIL